MNAAISANALFACPFTGNGIYPYDHAAFTCLVTHGVCPYHGGCSHAGIHQSIESYIHITNDDGTYNESNGIYVIYCGTRYLSNHVTIWSTLIIDSAGTFHPCSFWYICTAHAIWRKSVSLFVWRTLITAYVNLGISAAANNPIQTITINISIKVKDFLFIFFTIL